MSVILRFFQVYWWCEFAVGGDGGQNINLNSGVGGFIKISTLENQADEPWKLCLNFSRLLKNLDIFHKTSDFNSFVTLMYTHVLVLVFWISFMGKKINHMKNCDDLTWGTFDTQISKISAIIRNFLKIWDKSIIKSMNKILIYPNLPGPKNSYIYTSMTST